MKKGQFFLPKIIGATVIVGIATLLMATIFKLLMVASVIAIAVHLIGRRWSKNRMNRFGQRQYQQGFGAGYQGVDAIDKSSYFEPEYVTPVNYAKRASGIIPIN